MGDYKGGHVVGLNSLKGDYKEGSVGFRVLGLNSLKGAS